jgi:hypothetical protein
MILCGWLLLFISRYIIVDFNADDLTIKTTEDYGQFHSEFSR